MLYFGGLREALGYDGGEEELQSGSTVGALRRKLEDEQPALRALANELRIAVNRELAADDTVLRSGDEVAFLPPVSGGGSRCTLSEHPLETEAIAARVEAPGCGGAVTFVGSVRNRSRGREIEHLEYEAYPAMALQEMERIAAEAERASPGAQVAIAHRVGLLKIGEAAVVVSATAPHRAEAFAACRFAIEALKQRVPIWKKEVATDGAYWVGQGP